MLQARGITHLLFAGVTTEVCVQTIMREANDRGYDCLLLEDCTESYFPEFKAAALEMIRAQGAHRRLARAVGGAAARDRGRRRGARRLSRAASRSRPAGRGWHTAPMPELPDVSVYLERADAPRSSATASSASASAIRSCSAR